MGYPLPFCKPGLGCRSSAVGYLRSSTYLPGTSLGVWDILVYERLWLCSQVVDSLAEETDYKQVNKQTRLSKTIVSALKKIKQNKVTERSEGVNLLKIWSRVLEAEGIASANAFLWEQTEPGQERGKRLLCVEQKEQDETRDLNWPTLVGAVSQEKDFDFYLESSGKALKVSVPKSDML